MVLFSVYFLLTLCVALTWSQKNCGTLALDTRETIRRGETVYFPILKKILGDAYDKKYASHDVELAVPAIYAFSEHGELTADVLKKLVRKYVASIIVRNYFQTETAINSKELEKKLLEDMKHAGITLKITPEDKTQQTENKDKRQKAMHELIQNEAKGVTLLWNKFLIDTNHLPKHLKKIKKDIERVEGQIMKETEFVFHFRDDTKGHERHLQGNNSSDATYKEKLENGKKETTAEQENQKGEYQRSEADKSVETSLKRCDHIMNDIFILEKKLEKGIVKFVKKCSEAENDTINIMKEDIQKEIAKLINRLVKLRYEGHLLLENKKILKEIGASENLDQKNYGQMKVGKDKDEHEQGECSGLEEKEEGDAGEYLYENEKQINIAIEKLKNNVKMYLGILNEIEDEGRHNVIVDEQIHRNDEDETGMNLQKLKKALENDVEKAIEKLEKETSALGNEEGEADTITKKSNEQLKEQIELASIPVENENVENKAEKKVENASILTTQKMEENEKTSMDEREKETEKHEIKQEAVKSVAEQKGEECNEANERGDDENSNIKSSQYNSWQTDLERHISFLRQNKNTIMLRHSVILADITNADIIIEKCLSFVENLKVYVHSEVKENLQIYRSAWGEAKSLIYSDAFVPDDVERILMKLDSNNRQLLINFINTVVENLSSIDTLIRSVIQIIKNEYALEAKNMEQMRIQFKKVDVKLVEYKKTVMQLNLIYDTLKEHKLKLAKYFVKSKKELSKIIYAFDEHAMIYKRILKELLYVKRLANVMVYHEDLKSKLQDMRKIWKRYCLKKKKNYKKEKVPLIFQYEKNKNILFPPEFCLEKFILSKSQKNEESMSKNTDNKNTAHFNTEQKGSLHVSDVVNIDTTGMVQIDNDDLNKWKLTYEDSQSHYVFNSFYFKYIYSIILAKYDGIKTEIDMKKSFFKEYRSLDALIDICSVHKSNLKFLYERKKKSIFKLLQWKEKNIREIEPVLERTKIIKKLMEKLDFQRKRTKGEAILDLFIREFQYFFNWNERHFQFMERMTHFLKHKSFSVSKWKRFFLKHLLELKLNETETSPKVVTIFEKGKKQN